MIQQQETTLSVLQRTPRQDSSPEAETGRPAATEDTAISDQQEDPGPQTGTGQTGTVQTADGTPAEAAPTESTPTAPTTPTTPVRAPHRRTAVRTTDSPGTVAARLRDEADDSDQVPESGRRRGRHVREDSDENAPQLDPNLLRLAALSPTDPQYQQLRRTVIETHLPLVHHLAQRFKGRGEPYDDLVQVGTIGLLHAVDRFDPQRGAFAAFAVPTIVGEIRRHFRDRGWAMRIPRRIQDLGRRVSEARETLTHTLDRSPTVQELAEYLEVDADLVIEALDTASAYITVPLPTTAEESDRMGKAFEDAGLELVEQRETLRPLLARLPEREQRILELRFGKGLSQAQIAAEVGVSQMHVSRLLTKSLNILRSGLTQEL